MKTDIPVRVELLMAGLELISEYVNTNTDYLYRCTLCGGETTGTTKFKLMAFRKRGSVGCAECIRKHTYKDAKQTATQRIRDKGFEILSDYDGNQSSQSSITIRRIECGHEFISAPGNILHRDVQCPTCNNVAKAKRLQASHQDRWDEYEANAPAWKRYRSKVTSFTRYTYQEYKATINPDNKVFGKAGVEGAYQLDHIVSVKYGFVNDIPPELISHHTNLQMLPWLENLQKKDKIDHVPNVLKPFIDKAE